MSIITDPAEAQAIGICWLARQPGLPEVYSLRSAIAQLHATSCGWCDYPLPELMRMLENRSVSPFSEKAWWGMPGKARLRAIELAQGREAA